MSRLHLFLLAIACRNETKAIIEPSDSVVVQDLDGDGYDADEDCDDTSELINPGATEVCDGQDNNCDDQIDEGVLLTFYADQDEDGFGDPDAAVQACDPPAGTVPNANDCDDSDANAFPSNNEVCDDVDNNCDGEIDEGIGDMYFPDDDDDGFGADTDPVYLCVEEPGFTQITGDCNDNNETVHPDAEETCDNIDNNCNGSIDEGVSNTYFADVDEDGYGDPDAAVEACDLPAGSVENNADCDDAVAETNPLAAEYCDGIDNDCDGSTDEASAEDALTYYTDSDGDGYGDPSTETIGCELPQGTVFDGTDCDDSEALSNPGQQEVCDGIDNDCDGSLDDADSSISGVSDWWLDHDGDGYGDSALMLSTCAQPTGYVSNDQDCNDLDAAVSPSAAEICDEEDNDCDGDVDDLDSDVQLGADDSWFFDGDGDSYGESITSLQSCAAPGLSYVQNDGDCDDNEPLANPAATETCDGIDNDCDTLIDDADSAVTGTTDWWLDHDGDGYGDPQYSLATCLVPAGYTDNADDCDDFNGARNPGETEVCDGIDNDCDGAVDSADPAIQYAAGDQWYLDTDGDGFGDTSTLLESCGSPGALYVQLSGDCDEGDLSINPAAVEVCDAIDNDCNGVTDENIIGASTWYLDDDADSFGDPAVTQIACDQPLGFVADDTDCDDSESSANPQATEVFDGIDNDCDGAIDEDLWLGNGSDGDLDANAPIDLSVYASPGRSYADAVSYSVAAITGDTLTVSVAPDGIEVGDEVLLINVQGTPSLHAAAGTYEFAYVQSINGNVLTLFDTVAEIYGQSTNSDLSDQNIRVQRVPQYQEVTVSSELSISAFDGVSGGIIAFRATGTVLVDGGSITADGIGYRAGEGGSGSNCDSFQGESYAGLGSGEGSGNCDAYNETTGQWAANFGGGGAHITGGGGNHAGGATAGDSWTGGSATPPQAGISYGVSDLSVIFFGSGGGGVWNDGSGGGGPGGDGGGIIIIGADVIETTSASAIRARGMSTTNRASGSYTYGAGGGAGGSIFLEAASLSLAGSSIDVGGGSGMTVPLRDGGHGGYGRIQMIYDDLNGVAYPNPNESTYTSY